MRIAAAQTTTRDRPERLWGRRRGPSFPTDPYVPVFREDGLALESLPLGNGCLADVDCVLILTNHREFDYPSVAATTRLVVDTRNVLQGIEGNHIVRL
jgi:UDP-N-acetyl-D-glucosamine dehydrogenase